MKSIQYFENQVNDVCLLMLIFYVIEIIYIIIFCTPLKKVKNAMILIRLSLLILETMFLIFISILTILLLVLLFDFAHEGNYQHYLYLYVPIIITAMINIYLIYFYMKIYKEIVSKFKNVDYEIKKDLISITVKVLTIITIMLTGIKGFINQSFNNDELSGYIFIISLLALVFTIIEFFLLYKNKLKAIFSEEEYSTKLGIHYIYMIIIMSILFLVMLKRAIT
ncbi:hypothetical protein K4O99_09430 [Staphylococcus epidermidis]|nr:hypothetical protein [Staphylococcus epidermidis]MCG2152422.1 hypothetical protein [Staphylococcus epidermidis]